jgi:hypothetical protein
VIRVLQMLEASLKASHFADTIENAILQSLQKSRNASRFAVRNNKLFVDS